MKTQRILVYSVNGQVPIERKPFDIVGKECWVRYRGGRLFVRQEKDGRWYPFRVEPKRGNAYAV